MAVSKAEFRLALGHFASGVTVVTASFDKGSMEGITVTAFSSLSLEPPLVLICIEKKSRIHDRLHKGGHFAVNILAEDQEVVSRRFASADTERFRGIGYTTGTTGAPLLNDCLAWVECRIVAHFVGGDHTIFVGEVEAIRVTERKPLLYYRGGYTRLA